MTTTTTDLMLKIPSANPAIMEGVSDCKSLGKLVRVMNENLEKHKVDSLEAIFRALNLSTRKLVGEIKPVMTTRESNAAYFEGEKESTNPSYKWIGYQDDNDSPVEFFVEIDSTLCYGVRFVSKLQAKTTMADLKESGISLKMDSDKVTLYSYASKENFRHLDFSSSLLDITKLSLKEIGMFAHQELDKIAEVVL